jgi:EAL domain-containing protein (putative c-di-GMP-specific phosphodiesterase class I)
LVREADTAMYRAKAAGRDRYEVFDDIMRAEVADRVAIAQELRHALDRDELVLEYQPMVGVSDGSLTACEALLRWHHPQRGIVPPLSFIPLAEENGLIIPIGEWVLREACRQAAQWREEGDQVPVTVNVSPIQLVEPDFANKVASACADAGLPPQQLWIELVETSIVQQGETVFHNLSKLRDFGVRIALDDFGAGATSLSYFRSLPLDAVKLDRAFVRDLTRGSEDRAVVAALVSLAEEMDLMVVAEGVESEDQLAQLRELGCDYAQGFWFARPSPPKDIKVGGFQERARPGLGDPFVIREFMRQIGIPARIA